MDFRVLQLFKINKIIEGEIRMRTIVEHYRDNYQKYGANNEGSLGYTKNKQEVRFKQLLRFLKPNPEESLLDIGCGFADLYGYLKKNPKYDNIDYWGIDIMKEFIDIATQNYPKKADQLMCKDFAEIKEEQNFDYCIVSGTFNYKIFESESEQYEFINKMIEKALNMCNIGIAFDFLSDKVDYTTSEEDFHSSPEKILSLAYNFSRNVILDNSAMPFEFCITIFKNDHFNKNDTVFSLYKN